MCLLLGTHPKRPGQARGMDIQESCEFEQGQARSASPGSEELLYWKQVAKRQAGNSSGKSMVSSEVRLRQQRGPTAPWSIQTGPWPGDMGSNLSSTQIHNTQFSFSPLITRTNQSVFRRGSSGWRQWENLPCGIVLGDKTWSKDGFKSSFPNAFKGCYQGDGAWSFSTVWCEEEGHWPQIGPRDVHAGYKVKFLHLNDSSAAGQVAQRGCSFGGIQHPL